MEAIEQQRTQLIELIQTLPAEALQKAEDFITGLKEQADTSTNEQATEGNSPSPYEALKKAGLIGCIKDGEPDLSVNYKQYITKHLEEKHDYR